MILKDTTIIYIRGLVPVTGSFVSKTQNGSIKGHEVPQK